MSKILTTATTETQSRFAMSNVLPTRGTTFGRSCPTTVAPIAWGQVKDVPVRYRHVADLKDAFRGTSAWRPPS